MQFDYKKVWNDIEKIHKISPLIHNITNYVVMHSTANAILAVGASPVMAHSTDEVEEMTSLSSALVLNIGTLSSHWISAMQKSAGVANKKNIPIILDPVGAGATNYRTTTVLQLLENYNISILRGNASEINSLCFNNSITKGVDSILTPLDAIEAGKILSKKYHLTVSISGEVDVIIQNDRMIKVFNGHPMMGKVTGMGCIATAITAAFAAVNLDYFLASAGAMAAVGVAGEIAADKSNGIGSMEVNFIDALCNLNEKDLKERLKIEIL